LQGLVPSTTNSLLMQICFVSTDTIASELSDLLEDLQHLIQQYQHLFDPPVGLPPPRACNHLIPLLPNSKPIAMRPYMYPSKLKDELENR
jgi:hypothetical protein